MSDYLIGRIKVSTFVDLAGWRKGRATIKAEAAKLSKEIQDSLNSMLSTFGSNTAKELKKATGAYKTELKAITDGNRESERQALAGIQRIKKERLSAIEVESKQASALHKKRMEDIKRAQAATQAYHNDNLKAIQKQQKESDAAHKAEMQRIAKARAERDAAHRQRTQQEDEICKKAKSQQCEENLKKATAQRIAAEEQVEAARKRNAAEERKRDRQEQERTEKQEKQAIAAIEREDKARMAAERRVDQSNRQLYEKTARLQDQLLGSLAQTRKLKEKATAGDLEDLQKVERATLTSLQRVAKARAEFAQGKGSYAALFESAFDAEKGNRLAKSTRALVGESIRNQPASGDDLDEARRKLEGIGRVARTVGSTIRKAFVVPVSIITAPFRKAFNAIGRMGASVGRNFMDTFKFAVGDAIGNMFQDAFYKAIGALRRTAAGSLLDVFETPENSSIRGAIGAQTSEFQAATNLRLLTQIDPAQREEFLARNPNYRELSQDETENFITSLNRRLARESANLPGSTEDYKLLAQAVSDSVIPAFQTAQGVDLEGLEDTLTTITKTFSVLGAGAPAYETQVALQGLLEGRSTSELGRLKFFQTNAATLGFVEKELARLGVQSTSELSQQGRVALTEKVAGQQLDQEAIEGIQQTAGAIAQKFTETLFDQTEGLFGVRRNLGTNAAGEEIDGTSLFAAFEKLSKTLFDINNENPEEGGFLQVAAQAADRGLARQGINLEDLNPVKLQRDLLLRINELLEDNKGKLEAFFASEGVGNFIDSLTRAKNLVMGIGETLGSIAAVGFTGEFDPSSQLERFAALAFNTIDSVKSALGNIWEGLTAGFERNRESFDRLFDGLLDGGNESLPLIEQIGTAVGNVLGKVLDIVAELEESGALYKAIDFAVWGVDKMSDIIDFIGNNLTAVAGTATGIAGTVLGIKGTLKALETIKFLKDINFFTTMSGGVSKIGGTLSGVIKPALLAISKAMGAIAFSLGISVGTLGLIAAGIVAAGVAAFLLVKHWDDIVAGLKKAYKWTKEKLGEAMSNLGENVGKLGKKIGTKIVDGFEAAEDKVGDIGNAILDNIDKTGNWKKAIKSIGNTFAEISLNLLEFFNLGDTGIANWIKGVREGKGLFNQNRDKNAIDQGTAGGGPLGSFRDAFNTELISRSIGAAEGTRPGGEKGEAYFGHRDPGDGLHNVGSFSISSQRSGYSEYAGLSPEQADDKYIKEMLRPFAKEVYNDMKKAGLLQHSHATELFHSALDAFNQSQVAGRDFASQLQTVAGAIDNGQDPAEAIARIRANAYIDPSTGQLDAPGLGNDMSRVLADQLRRTQEVLGALPQQVARASKGFGSDDNFLLGGQSLDGILNYKPTSGQDFLAARGGGRTHAGVDIDASGGGGAGADVYSISSGRATLRKILDSNVNGDTSVQVLVEFVDDNGNKITEEFNHLSGNSVAEKLGLKELGGNVEIKAGQALGRVSATDRLSSGAHLDLKVYADGAGVAGSGGIGAAIRPQDYIRAVSQGGGTLTNLAGGRVNLAGRSNPTQTPAPTRTLQQTLSTNLSDAPTTATRNRADNSALNQAGLAIAQNKNYIKEQLQGEAQGLVDTLKDTLREDGELSTSDRENLKEMLERIVDGNKALAPKLETALDSVDATLKRSKAADGGDDSSTKLSDTLSDDQMKDFVAIRNRELKQAEQAAKNAGIVLDQTRRIQDLENSDYLKASKAEFDRRRAALPTNDAAGRDAITREQQQFESEFTNEGALRAIDRQIADLREKQKLQEKRAAIIEAKEQKIEEDLAANKTPEVDRVKLEEERQALDPTDYNLMISALERAKVAQEALFDQESANRNLENQKRLTEELHAQGMALDEARQAQLALRNEGGAFAAQLMGMSSEAQQKVKEAQERLNSITNQLAATDLTPEQRNTLLDQQTQAQSVVDGVNNSSEQARAQFVEDHYRQQQQLLRGIRDQVEGQGGAYREVQTQIRGILEGAQDQELELEKQIESLSTILETEQLQGQELENYKGLLSDALDLRGKLAEAAEREVQAVSQAYALDQQARFANLQQTFLDPTMQTFELQAENAANGRDEFRANEIKQAIALKRNELAMDQALLENNRLKLQFQQEYNRALLAGDQDSLDRFSNMGINSASDIDNQFLGKARTIELNAELRAEQIDDQFVSITEKFEKSITDSFQAGLSNGIKGIAKGEMGFMEALKNTFMGIYDTVIGLGAENLANAITNSVTGQEGGIGDLWNRLTGNRQEEDEAVRELDIARQAALSYEEKILMASQQGANMYAQAIGGAVPQVGTPGSPSPVNLGSVFGDEPVNTFRTNAFNPVDGPLSTLGSLDLNSPAPAAVPTVDSGVDLQGVGMTWGKEFNAETEGFGTKEGLDFGSLLQQSGNIFQNLLGSLGKGGGGGLGGAGGIISSLLPMVGNIGSLFGAKSLGGTGKAEGIASFAKGLTSFSAGGPVANAQPMPPSLYASGILSYSNGGSISNLARKEYLASGKTPRLIMVNEGEYIMSAPAVTRLGLDRLDALNQGHIPNMAAGGPVVQEFATPAKSANLAGGIREGTRRSTVEHKIGYTRLGNMDVVSKGDLDRVMADVNSRMITKEQAVQATAQAVRGSYQLRKQMGVR